MLLRNVKTQELGNGTDQRLREHFFAFWATLLSQPRGRPEGKPESRPNKWWMESIFVALPITRGNWADGGAFLNVAAGKNGEEEKKEG